jgi:hypothetical protein
MRFVFVMLTVICLLLPSVANAQRGGRGGTPATPRASAPIDLTGYWTAVITEDWHVRMLTAPRSDFGAGAIGAIEMPGNTHSVNGPVGIGDNPALEGNIPYRAEAAQIALKWDPDKDEAEGNQCKAYGAPAIMRLPTRLHITWQDDNTLKVDTDYGSQTRLFHFRPPPRPVQNPTSADFVVAEAMDVRPPAGLQPSWQGYSVAWWNIVGGTRNVNRGGNLKVVTSRLKSGYYWKNGMPYTGNAILTEQFRILKLPDGTQWLIVSEMVEDPEYLVEPFVLNYHFKKLPDGSQWSPTPCSVK